MGLSNDLSIYIIFFYFALLFISNSNLHSISRTQYSTLVILITLYIENSTLSLFKAGRQQLLRKSRSCFPYLFD